MEYGYAHVNPGFDNQHCVYSKEQPSNSIINGKKISLY
jgi:hypothetical protein